MLSWSVTVLLCNIVSFSVSVFLAIVRVIIVNQQNRVKRRRILCSIASFMPLNYSSCYNLQFYFDSRVKTHKCSCQSKNLLFMHASLCVVNARVLHCLQTTIMTCIQTLQMPSVQKTTHDKQVDIKHIV